MQIKSLDELKKIRENSLKKVNLRQTGESDSPHTEILVGMSTCGIASGARETLNALVEEVNNNNLMDVKVIQVGCIGLCHSEPIIQVNRPNEKPVVYGKIDPSKGREIIKEHIINGKVLDQYVIDVDFVRP
ncbi:MAG: (2Fe-2S) ferredoxin domain-containing protein [Anaeromicrobium sp.]|jgi:NADP-reducing hydrogenase subunit HndB|uniref:(2Fe-2S) ferredoxin domain-containing protein n=1 Tax=Anaeromicrobium sp. TaxID=1929132 RepID=UPI0025E32DEF|nr:(2Fe-2S) ferredoxin domain-containing protein [Anaeromicrobium sp.]MCT4593607.1 (2Fe-2S) ferredoxin domain-containing protein [Anaeromicrobium sp.]